MSVLDAITLIVVALLGVLVGAVGVGAFRLSQRQQDVENGVDPQYTQPPVDLLAMTSALPGIVIVVDPDNKIVRADAKAYAKGLARHQELTHPALIEVAARVRAEGVPLTTEMTLPRSDLPEAAELFFRVRVAPLPGDLLLIVAEDLTIQRRNEAARRDFTANVSHELKTPVGAVRLLAETIAENSDDSEAVAYFASRLSKESERLSTLVQDIIDLSRLQSPDALDSPDLVSVKQVISEALHQEEFPAEQARIELRGPDPALEAYVWGDKDMLVMAVRNLVDNAVRYSHPDSWVRVDAVRNQERICIRVIDTGIGISSEHQQRIFERFFRVDTARSRETGGTGLGLSIVKHVASDHGGTVTVASLPGRGSTFTLVLPEAEIGENGDELKDKDAR